MRKSDIQKLINSYDGKDPESTFFQKGFRKKMFGLRTKGMNELNSFLNSAEMQQLKPEDEITGKNLEELLKIMKAREERIFETNRSYENNFNKSTNRVFQELYDLLWKDAVKAHDNGTLESPENTKCLEILFKRESNKNVVKQLEDIKSTATLLEKGRQLFTLGFSMCKERIIELCTRKELQKEVRGTDDRLLEFKLNDQTIFVIRNTDPDAEKLPHEIIPGKLLLGNQEKGLQLLHEGSKAGSKTCSFTLAHFYADIKDEANPLPNVSSPDPDKAIHYLQLAAQQGSTTADVLLGEEYFGSIKLSPNKSPSI